MIRAEHMALASRSVVFLAMIFWALMCKAYDTSAALDMPCLEEFNSSSSSNSGVFSRTVVWDAVYYVRIARCGYEYEQMYAFQPLLPLLMKLLANSLLRGLLSVLGYHQTLALAGYAINFVAFVLAAVYLYRLSLYVLEDETMSLGATAFFCFNPASVFYSSIYTESLFALFSFAGMWYFVSGSKWKSAVCFGLSGVARSNGTVHAGFFIFQALHLCFRKRDLAFIAPLVLQTGLQVGCVFAPFILFQAYGYYQLCLDENTRRPWCDATIPNLYGFVQRHYWNVGFLRYFETKQIPNFLSASPALFLSGSAIVTYVINQPKLFYSIGLSATSWQTHKAALLPNALSSTKAKQKPVAKRSSGYFSAANVPFVFELLFMTGVAFFVMHVQVSTRFLSSSPVLYWFAAHLMKRKLSYLIWSVFLSYLLVGTLLFINFYPFT